MRKKMELTEKALGKQPSEKLGSLPSTNSELISLIGLKAVLSRIGSMPYQDARQKKRLTMIQ